MASPDHLAKRRRLNSPPSDRGEPDNDYVCYGMVSPTKESALLQSVQLLLNTLPIACRFELPGRQRRSST
jgi:hypothetical protein